MSNQAIFDDEKDGNSFSRQEGDGRCPAEALLRRSGSAILSALLMLSAAGANDCTTVRPQESFSHQPIDQILVTLTGGAPRMKRRPRPAATVRVMRFDGSGSCAP